MLERLHIKNFRALRDLEMDELARINLIGGRNNSGKTSLLEALFLLSTAGKPGGALDTNLIRTDGARDERLRRELVKILSDSKENIS